MPLYRVRIYSQHVRNARERREHCLIDHSITAPSPEIAKRKTLRRFIINGAITKRYVTCQKVTAT